MQEQRTTTADESKAERTTTVQARLRREWDSVMLELTAAGGRTASFRFCPPYSELQSMTVILETNEAGRPGVELTEGDSAEGVQSLLELAFRFLVVGAEVAQ